MTDKLPPKVASAFDILLSPDTVVTLGVFDEKHEVRRIKQYCKRLTDENGRLRKVEVVETERRLAMEDVELYLMEVSQPDDENAAWDDRMRTAIECLVQDCNDANREKHEAIARAEQAEAERDALKARIAEAPTVHLDWSSFNRGLWIEDPRHEADEWEELLSGKTVRLIVEDAAHD